MAVIDLKFKTMMLFIGVTFETGNICFIHKTFLFMTEFEGINFEFSNNHQSNSSDVLREFALMGKEI